MIHGLKFHHIGLVVKSIDDYQENSFFSEPTSGPVYDPIQDSNLALYKTDKSFFIELIEPLTPNATTFDYLSRSEKSSVFHHTCYEASNMEIINNISKTLSIKIFWGPNPAVLFDGREIMFGYSKNQEIVEFLLPKE